VSYHFGSTLKIPTCIACLALKFFQRKSRKNLAQTTWLNPPQQVKFWQPIRQSRPQQRLNSHHPIRHDLYHWLLIISWPQFLGSVSLFYLTVNALFAFAYLLPGNQIINARPGSFSDAFFFSIQTLSTVGYGSLSPQGLFSQFLMTAEILVGFLLMAILTGLMFARFSRPTARIIFSQVAVVCPFQGIPTLMFRTANRRDNRILEAQIQVSLVRNESSQEGHQLRRFYDLKLLRSRTPIFALSWLVMHPIDAASPLSGETGESLAEIEAEIWVGLTGLDETFSQTIHARHSYNTDEILWDRRFVDIFSQTPDGRRYIDLERFHDVLPLEPT
jgi:inward rectifier potassium channel